MRTSVSAVSRASLLVTIATLSVSTSIGCTGFDPSGVRPGARDAGRPDAPANTPDASPSVDAPTGRADAAVADAASLVDSAPLDAAPTVDAQTPGCYGDSRYDLIDPATGHRYWLYEDVFLSTQRWPQASMTCLMDEAHLPVVETEAENDFLRARLAAGPMWIGLHDRNTEGDYEWVTGAPFGYDNWAPGEPSSVADNDDCVEVLGNGSWNDTGCGFLNSKAFFCECDPAYLP